MRKRIFIVILTLVSCASISDRKLSNDEKRLRGLSYAQKQTWECKTTPGTKETVCHLFVCDKSNTTELDCYEMSKDYSSSEMTEIKKNQMNSELTSLIGSSGEIINRCKYSEFYDGDEICSSEIKTKSVSIYTICIGKKHSLAATEIRGLCFEKTCSILKDSDCTSRGSKKIFDWYISSNTKK